MRVADLMQKDVRTISPDAPVTGVPSERVIVSGIVITTWLFPAAA